MQNLSNTLKRMNSNLSERRIHLPWTEKNVKAYIYVPSGQCVNEINIPF